MNANRIQKISTAEDIDLSRLTFDELNRLQFEEEFAAAQKILAAIPFSEERDELMKKGYGIVHTIMHEKALRKNSSIDSYGVGKISCQLVKKLIDKYKNQTKKDQIVFYEAGVGMGMVICSLLDDHSIQIKGCDINLNRKLKENPHFDLYEGSIFDSLSRLEDNSIDIFYWNDVFEHLLDDEIDEYMKLIYRKIAKEGIIVTITPNRLIGPSDISRDFLPHGSKAKGFHFHEYTYFELKKLFLSYGFKNDYPVLKNPVKRNYVIVPKNRLYTTIIEFFKFVAESLAFCIYPWSLRQAVINGLGCQVYVFRK